MSTNKITFLHDFLPNDYKNNLIYYPESSITRFYFSDYIEVDQFLDGLDDDKLYVLSLELVYCWESYDDNSPVIVLSKPFLVTKDSNPRLISRYLQYKINIACHSYSLDEELIHAIDVVDKPGIIVRYKEII
jgi:hypothetical protein